MQGFPIVPLFLFRNFQMPFVGFLFLFRTLSVGVLCSDCGVVSIDHLLHICVRRVVAVAQETWTHKF